MTYVLLITNNTDVTTDFIVRELSDRKVPFYRFNTETLGSSVFVELDFTAHIFFLKEPAKDICIDLTTVSAVYFRRPEIPVVNKGLSPGEINFVRAEYIFTLEGIYSVLHNARWLNHVNDIRLAENKIYQLLVAQKLGFTIPQSIVTNLPQAALSFYNRNHQHCIIKPVKSGLVESEQEEGVIFTNPLILDEQSSARIKPCPVYLQQQVDKESDLRITVVGNKVFAAKIHSQESTDAMVDWRRSPQPLAHTEIQLPGEVEQKCIELTKKLSLNFGAIDMILDKDGNYFFLEINPNGQWAWIEKRIGLPISKTITDTLLEKLF